MPFIEKRFNMPKIITVINQKGGVGKTTTAHNIGAWLKTIKKKKVLFIDLDQQGNLSYATKSHHHEYTSIEILTSKQIDVGRCFVSENDYYIVPSHPNLASIDKYLPEVGKEYQLKNALRNLDDFDYVIIDTPPTLNILTINALTASNYALIPTQADIFSLQGISQLSQTIDAVKEYTNPNLEILGIVLTKHNTRSILNRDLQAITKDTAISIHTKVYTQYIRENISIKEAQATQNDIFSYSPYCNAAIDYDALMNQIWKEIK